jgi:hypothetical protein
VAVSACRTPVLLTSTWQIILQIIFIFPHILLPVPILISTPTYFGREGKIPSACGPLYFPIFNRRHYSSNNPPNLLSCCLLLLLFFTHSQGWLRGVLVDRVLCPASPPVQKWGWDLGLDLKIYDIS